jgi:hypothetical protein
MFQKIGDFLIDGKRCFLELILKLVFSMLENLRFTEHSFKSFLEAPFFICPNELLVVQVLLDVCQLALVFSQNSFKLAQFCVGKLQLCTFG